MKILVTGAAGFIGFHLVQKLLERGDEVIGLDAINDYYDTKIKFGRLELSGISQNKITYKKVTSSTKFKNYKFIQGNLEDAELIRDTFSTNKFDAVCNLAAQAGVRYSLENPQSYLDSNINGFLNILENCRNFKVDNFSFASSSSVYGLNSKLPFATSDNVDHPISLYAASKKANELMAHTYSHLFGIRATGLRFFTVYGPWGRPDMALFLFTKAAFEGSPIKVFNHGNMLRDFTYIDDIINGVVRVIDRPAKPNPDWNSEKPDPSTSSAPYKIYNIGNNNPVQLMEFIDAIENATEKKIKREMLPIQPGDVPSTYADIKDLSEDMNFKPECSIEYGVNKFVNWYREFYKV